MDSNTFRIIIFLDLSKEFDTLNHEILLEKLKYYGIDGVAHNLKESYLTNRKQFYEIDDIISYIFNVNIAVPQGSILGPLLFYYYLC